MSALELFAQVADPGTYRDWAIPLVDVNPNEKYAAELARAAEKSGVDESVISGEALIHGRRVAFVACEFRFMAGTIGMAAAERLVATIERATAEGLPLLAGPASGGTRMQEGTLAFMAMVKISAAIARHKNAGLPYLVYLRNPTTGGVMATWGSLGHLTVAEPGALVGFLGPRVHEALFGFAFPEGVQTSENLFRHGLLDAVVTPEQLPAIIDRVLGILMTPREQRFDDALPQQMPIAFTGTADSIERSRRRDRPGVKAFLRYAASDVLPLNGTGEGEHDPGVILALARFGGVSCVIMGQDRVSQRTGKPLGPAALREARRGMRLAVELKLPLVTVIDTPGAALTREAEEGGLAQEIARCLSDLTTIETPVVSVILGEGTGGGAIALLPADYTIASQHGWLAPLPPEGASAIIHRNLDHAMEMAEAQGVSSQALLANKIVDHVVPEQPDAADEPAEFCTRLATTLEQALAHLSTTDTETLLNARYDRYRRLGL
jgi:acetyl-CoA carboxylase beta subunit